MVNIANADNTVSIDEASKPSVRDSRLAIACRNVDQLLSSCTASNPLLESVRSWARSHSTEHDISGGLQEAVQHLQQCFDDPNLSATALDCLNILSKTEACTTISTISDIASSLFPHIQPQVPNTPAALTLLSKVYTSNPSAFDSKHTQPLISTLSSTDQPTAQQALIAVAAASATDANAATLAKNPILPSTLAAHLNSKHGISIKYSLITIATLSSHKPFQTAALQQGCLQSSAKVLRLHHPSLSPHAASALCALLRNSPAAQDIAASISLHISLIKYLHPQQIQQPVQLLDCISNLLLKHTGNQTAFCEAKGHLPLLHLLCNKDPKVVEAAARALSNAVLGSADMQAAVAAAGGCQLLCRLLRARVAAVLKQVLAALANLVLRHAGNQQQLLQQEGAVSELVRVLRLQQSAAVQERAALLVTNLSSSCAAAQEELAAAGAVAPLVAMLDSSRNCVVQHAAAALGNLAISNRPNQELLLQQQVAPKLVKLLSARSTPVVNAAAHAIASLTYDNAAAQAAVADAGGLAALVRLCKTLNPGAAAEVVRALGNVVHRNPELQQQAAAAGAVPALVKLLHSRSVALQQQVAAALGHLVDANEQLQDQVCAMPHAVPSLVRLMCHKSADTQARAAAALAALSSSSAAAQHAVVQAAAVPLLVRLVAADSVAAAAQAAAALAHVAGGCREHRMAVVQAGGLTALMKLLGHPSSALLKPVVAALAALGGVASLVKLLGHQSIGVVERAAAALADIAAASDAGKEQLLQAKAVPALLHCLATRSHAKVSEHVAAALAALARWAPARLVVLQLGGAQALQGLVGRGHTAAALLAADALQQLMM